MLSAIAGFKIPFITKPWQLKEPYMLVTDKIEIDRVQSLIDKYISTGAIVVSEEEENQFISSVFSVPKSDGNFRLVINLKNLNEFVHAPHFKMEDYRTASCLLRQGCYMAVLDVKEAYHMIPVNKEDHKFLKFRWDSKLYKFTCIPFGLNVAPYLYTKIMKPVLSTLRGRGYESVSFLDDSLLIGDTESVVNSSVLATLELYKALGIRVNFEKSKLVPSQNVRFLGFMFNSNDMTLSLPLEKRDKIRRLCTQSLEKNHIRLLQLAELLGVLTSACPAVKYGQIHTRALEQCKIAGLQANRMSYSGLVSLPTKCKEDLLWWLNNINTGFNHLKRDHYDLRLTTDASRTGWGSERDGVISRGNWSLEERSYHINALELLAIQYGLLALAKVTNSNILVRSDSTTAISYINRYGGCRSSSCHMIADRVWKWCEDNNNVIFATYINTKRNIVADYLSRQKTDESDFMIGKRYFKEICDRFGQPSFDLFASYRTNQLPDYASFYPDPYAKNVDSFTMVWNFYFYAFPPFNMISRVLHKVLQEKAKGILVVPAWDTQPWYPLFKKMTVSSMITFKKSKGLLFCPYQNRSHPMSKRVNLHVAVVDGNRWSVGNSPTE